MYAQAWNQSLHRYSFHSRLACLGWWLRRQKLLLSHHGTVTLLCNMLCSISESHEIISCHVTQRATNYCQNWELSLVLSSHKSTLMPGKSLEAMVNSLDHITGIFPFWNSRLQCLSYLCPTPARNVLVCRGMKLLIIPWKGTCDMLQQMHGIFQQVHCGAEPQTIPEISVQPAKMALTSEARSQVRALWKPHSTTPGWLWKTHLINSACVQTVWFGSTCKKVQLIPEFRVSSLRGTRLCWHNPNKLAGQV